MIRARFSMIGAALLVSAGVGAQSPAALPAATELKIGTRVGVTIASGYDDGGRRDPFASLIREQPTVIANNGETVKVRAKGLAGVAVNDVSVKGIITSGEKWIAIVAGPDGASYLARTDDKLHDGSIRRIDRESVVFLARVQDGTGKTVSREVRKGIRATAGEAR